MRQVSLKLIAVIAAALAMLVASGCSADDPGLLPGDDAQQILANLDRVEDLAANGECSAALESIETISTQIAALPDSVSDRLKQNLRRGVRRLSEVTASSCGVPSDTTETVPETTETETETTNEQTTESGGTTGETGGGNTGSTGPGGTPRGNGNSGGRGGGGGSNRPDNRPTPPRGEGGPGNSGGPGQQPNPGGGETAPPGDNSDSGGISPEEQTEGEATP